MLNTSFGLGMNDVEPAWADGQGMSNHFRGDSELAVLMNSLPRWSDQRKPL